MKTTVRSILLVIGAAILGYRFGLLAGIGIFVTGLALIPDRADVFEAILVQNIKQFGELDVSLNGIEQRLTHLEEKIASELRRWSR
jgi:hypothetical protein